MAGAEGSRCREGAEGSRTEGDRSRDKNLRLAEAGAEGSRCREGAEGSRTEGYGSREKNLRLAKAGGQLAREAEVGDREVGGVPRQPREEVDHRFLCEGSA